MIKRTDERLGLKRKRLAADTAYGAGKFLSWLIGTGITPDIPVWDMSQWDDGTFSRSDFTFDKDRTGHRTEQPCHRRWPCRSHPVERSQRYSAARFFQSG